MADYTVLIIGETDRWWTTMSLEERKAGYADYGKFQQALMSGGHEICGGAELTKTADIRAIPAGGGPVTQGPYAETAEQIIGYYQIRTDDLHGLLECCQILAAIGDRVEVRPNVDDASRLV